MTHIFDPNKAYSILTTGSEVSFVEEAGMDSVDARVQKNVTEFCNAAKSVANNVLPQPAMNTIMSRKIQQLLSFGEGLSNDMQERNADFDKQKIQNVKHALDQLQAAWVDLKFQKLLKDTPYDASDVSDTSTISFCIRAFTAICDGKGNEYLKDQNFISFKNLFFQHIHDLHKLVLNYEGKNTTEIDAFSDQEKAKYKALMAKLQECYKCLERLFVEKNELFEEREKRLLGDLLKFFVFGAPYIRLKFNVPTMIPHMKVTHLLKPILTKPQDEDPIATREKEYQAILNGPKSCLDFTKDGALYKLLKLFSDIVSKKVPFFDKPKNFQDIKKLFIQLVGELAEIQRIRFDEEIEFEEDVTREDQDRLQKLLECYQCLIKMFITDSVLMEQNAHDLLKKLDPILFDNLPDSLIDSFKEFRERLRAAYKEDSNLKKDLAAFYEMIFPDQLQKLAQMIKQQKRNIDSFFDQMVRKYMELQNHRQWKNSIDPSLDEFFAQLDDSLRSKWKDKFQERLVALKMEKLSLK